MKVFFYLFLFFEQLGWYTLPGVGALHNLRTPCIGSDGTDCCSCCFSDMESAERLASPTSSQTSIRAAANPETSPSTTRSKSGKKHPYQTHQIKGDRNALLFYSQMYS